MGGEFYAGNSHAARHETTHVESSLSAFITLQDNARPLLWGELVRRSATWRPGSQGSWSGVEVVDDLNAVLQLTSWKEQAYRFNQLAAKYPSDTDVCVHLARAEVAAGNDDEACAAIVMALQRAAEPPSRSFLDSLHRIALDMTTVASRMAACNAILRYRPGHVPSLHTLTIDHVRQGAIDSARTLLTTGQAADDRFWSKLPPFVQEILGPQRAIPDRQHLVGSPLFPHGEYRVVRLASRSANQVLYDAVDAEERPWTLRTLLGVDPAQLHGVLLDLQTSERKNKLLLPQRKFVRASDGALYQVFGRIHGHTFNHLHATPVHDVDALIDIVWHAALAIAHLHDDGIVVGFTGDDAILLDADGAQRIAFLDLGFSARRRHGRAPLITGDPFPLDTGSDDERFRDVYALAALLYQGLTGTRPPVPYHERELTNLPEGEAGAKLRSVLSSCLDLTTVRTWGTARAFANALDRVHVWEPAQIHPGYWLDEWTLDELKNDDGGYAEIWSASSANRSAAALKILRREHQVSRAARQALEQEVRVMPSHHAFPRVFAAQRSRATPLAYYAMELLQGMSLHDALQDGPLDLEASVELGCQLAEAIQVVHANGLVHCDIKAENVFLEGAKRQSRLLWNQAKLLDFGSARSTAREFSPGMVFFTYASAAPELWQPSAPSPVADVYALGLLLYLCYTGHHAFRANTEAEWRNCQERVPLAPDLRLDAAPMFRMLLREMTQKEPNRRLPLFEVRKQLTQLAIELKLPFAQRTVGRHYGDAILIDSPQLPIEPAPLRPIVGSAEESARDATPPGLEPPTRPRLLWPWLTVGIAVALIVGAAAFYYTQQPPSCSTALVPDGDKQALGMELKRLLERGCTSSARQLIDRLERGPSDWGLTADQRAIWAAQLRAAVENIRE